MMQERGYFKTGVGIIEIVGDIDGINAVNFVDKMLSKKIPVSLRDYCKQLLEYFDGKRKKFKINLHLAGTEFQKKVWRELIKIPYGATASYKEIASRIGHDKASRVVGNANHSNPIPIIIPCHRVICSDGKIGGYSSGVDIKNKLLLHEEKFK